MFCMNSIYSIYEGLLRGMEDTLTSGESDAKKVLIADWLNKNKDYVKMFLNRVSEYTVDSKLRINSNGELDIFDFKPVEQYLDDSVMPLPVPEYIKFNNVDTMSII